MIHPIIRQLEDCMSSPYYEIVERALQVWKTPSFREILEDSELGPDCFRRIYKALHHPNHDQFTWYPDANDTILEVIEELQEVNEQWWANAAAEHKRTRHLYNPARQHKYRQDVFAQMALIADAKAPELQIGVITET